MDTARLTDERLRHALNSDQPSRERLCMAVLALDRNYSDVKPRRPEGGPDGGRDIECRRGPNLCYGAVGFVNNFSDSPKDKRQIKKKFKDDLDAALKYNRDLKAFVFFANVDLTPSEVQGLEQSAEASGISFVDIYYRERIRHALDSPRRSSDSLSVSVNTTLGSRASVFFQSFWQGSGETADGQIRSPGNKARPLRIRTLANGKNT